MRRIHVKESFQGYPGGHAEGSKRVNYEAGDEPEVPITFADLVVGKGHARELTAKEAAAHGVAPAPVAKISGTVPANMAFTRLESSRTEPKESAT